jgi:hypothetical protein
MEITKKSFVINRIIDIYLVSLQIVISNLIQFQTCDTTYCVIYDYMNTKTMKLLIL